MLLGLGLKLSAKGKLHRCKLGAILPWSEISASRLLMHSQTFTMTMDIVCGC